MKDSKIVCIAVALVAWALGCSDGAQAPLGSGKISAAGQTQNVTQSLASGESVTIKFVWCPAGSFQMGSPTSEEDRYENEGPTHQVTISSGFWLGQYELTQGQWTKVMGTQPWNGASQVDPNKTAQHPALWISFSQVQQFMQKLNAQATHTYRLPTEAEWEYACRAGTTTRWSFGDDVSDLATYAWYRPEPADPLVQPPGYWDQWVAKATGGKQPNPWGFYDMHGNVREWVEDRYAPSYITAPLNNGYSARGGTFIHFARTTRSAARTNGYKDALYLQGFRVAWDGPAP